MDVSNDRGASFFEVEELCTVYRKPVSSKSWYAVAGLYGVKTLNTSISINTVFTNPATGL
jgi:hypothetical protein